MNERTKSSGAVFLLLTIGSPAFLVGCDDDLVVGAEAKGDKGASSLSAVPQYQPQPFVPSSEDPACREIEEYMAESRNAWLNASNDWGTLAGSQWEGYIDLGPSLRLTIDPQNNALAVFGDEELLPPPSDPNAVFDCVPTYASEQNYCPFTVMPQVEYVIHGAAFNGRRLTFPLQANSPWDEWCSLQMPVNTSLGEDVPESCDYEAARDPEALQVLGLGEQLCRCIESGCFASIPGEFSFDLTLSDDGQQLGGSYEEWDGNAQPLQLWRVD